MGPQPATSTLPRRPPPARCAPRTIQTYVARVACFARYFRTLPRTTRVRRRPRADSNCRRRALLEPVQPGRLRPALLYGVTLGRPEQLPLIPYSKRPRTLPPCWLPKKSCADRRHARPGPRQTAAPSRAYACTVCASAKTVHLRVTDVDSARMVVVVRQGKAKGPPRSPLPSVSPTNFASTGGLPAVPTAVPWRRPPNDAVGGARQQRCSVCTSTSGPTRRVTRRAPHATAQLRHPSAGSRR